MCYNGFVKYRASNVTVAESTLSLYSKTKPDNIIPLEGHRRIRMKFFGTDAANEAFTVTVYGVDKGGPGLQGDEDDSTEWYTVILGTILCTLGTTTGVVGGIINENQFWCDGNAWTADLGDGDFFPTSFGGLTNYTGTSNNIGEAGIVGAPGFYGIVVRFTALTTAASGNMVYQLISGAGSGG